MKFNNRLEIQLVLGVLVLLAAVAAPFIRGCTTQTRAEEIEPAASTPLAAAILRSLTETPQYIELTTLRKKSDTATPRHRKLQAVIRRLRAEALSASTVDPEKPGEREVNYIGGDGNIHRFTGMIPQKIDSDADYLNSMAPLIAGSIVESATIDGLIPFDLPADVQKNVDAAMKDGYAAATNKDYISAIGHFEKARALSPHAGEIYYNLGLAESQVPGRELRAIVWFGAYLATDPESPQATAIRQQIPALDNQGLTRLIGIITEISDPTPEQRLKDLYLEGIADLWARTGNYIKAFETAGSIQSGDIKASGFAKIAGAQARGGDPATALQTAKLILDVTSKSSALLNIAEAQLGVGKMEIAESIIGAIEDPFYKGLGQLRFSRAQKESGDTASALQTLTEALETAKNIEEANLKNVMHQNIAVALAWTGDLPAAFRTADGIQDNFNVSLAKQSIAGVQALNNDWEDAQKTLAQALEAANKLPEGYAKVLALQGCAEVKGRLDTYTKKDLYDTPTLTPAPSVSPWAWVALNENSLNAPFFLDLRTYMKDLPKDDQSKMWEPLKAMAQKMVETREEIYRMLKEQERRRSL